VTDASRKKGAYMFGPMVLVQPVTSKLDVETNLSSHYLHFPAFEDTTEEVAWVERGSGRCFRGGQTLTDVGYRLEETAEFVRPGSMLPMVPTPSAQWNVEEYSNTSSVCPSLAVDGKASKPPAAALLGAAARAPCTIVWHVYLGNATSGSGELLEDEGRSAMQRLAALQLLWRCCYDTRSPLIYLRARPRIIFYFSRAPRARGRRLAI
jgi:hypothetical protein